MKTPPRSALIWIGPLVLVASWQAASSLGALPARVLPAPDAVVRAAIRLTLSGALAENIAVSAARALTGLAIGGAIGFFLGLLTGASKLAQALLEHRFIISVEYPDLPPDARAPLENWMNDTDARYTALRATLPKSTAEAFFFKEEEVRWSWEMARRAVPDTPPPDL